MTISSVRSEPIWSIAAFTRIDAGEVPDAKTILKIAGALGPDVIEQLHRQVVEVAKRAGVTHGRRFRIDTTVVEMCTTLGQLAVAGRRARADPHDAARECRAGGPAWACAQSPAQRRPTHVDHWPSGAVAGGAGRPGLQLSPD
jgi:hypothetical protein